MLCSQLQQHKSLAAWSRKRGPAGLPPSRPLGRCSASWIAAAVTSRLATSIDAARDRPGVDTRRGRGECSAVPQYRLPLFGIGRDRAVLASSACVSEDRGTQLSAYSTYSAYAATGALLSVGSESLVAFALADGEITSADARQPRLARLAASREEALSSQNCATVC